MLTYLIHHFFIKYVLRPHTGRTSSSFELIHYCMNYSVPASSTLLFLFCPERVFFVTFRYLLSTLKKWLNLTSSTSVTPNWLYPFSVKISNALENILSECVSILLFHFKVEDEKFKGIFGILEGAQPKRETRGRRRSIRDHT